MDIVYFRDICDGDVLDKCPSPTGILEGRSEEGVGERGGREGRTRVCVCVCVCVCV